MRRKRDEKIKRNDLQKTYLILKLIILNILRQKKKNSFKERFLSEKSTMKPVKLTDKKMRSISTALDKMTPECCAKFDSIEPMTKRDKN